MMKDKNISIDSIEDCNINGIEETIETSTEASINPSPDDMPKKKPNVHEQKEEHSSSVTSVDTNLSHKLPTHPIPSSITYIDTNLSGKYQITLEQARNRVLRAIKRAKKRNLLLEEDD